MPWLLDHWIGRSRASPDVSTACSIAVRLSGSDSPPDDDRAPARRADAWVRHRRRRVRIAFASGHLATAVHGRDAHRAGGRAVSDAAAAALLRGAGVPARCDRRRHAARHHAPKSRSPRCTSRGRSDGSPSSTASVSCRRPTARFSSPVRCHVDTLAIARRLLRPSRPAVTCASCATASSPLARSRLPGMNKSARRARGDG